MLEANLITKSFGALQVLKGVSLVVEEHEIVSVVGASGAGKTTLLQILGSLLQPDSGKVLIHGKDIFSFGEKELSRFRNTAIGFVFQFHHPKVGKACDVHEAANPEFEKVHAPFFQHPTFLSWQ